jgi:hypothetical protein
MDNPSIVRKRISIGVSSQVVTTRLPTAGDPVKADLHCLV